LTRDPRTGETAVTAVHRREEIFTGDYVEVAPDLIVEWKGFCYMPSEDLSSSGDAFGGRTREYMNWPTSGRHRPEGILIAAGSGLSKGQLGAPVELVDLTPTWLELLGCSIPETIEGKSVAHAFRWDTAAWPADNSVPTDANV
jgi:predicted AlkP superfamily phosphohydrolase/phosphomutase